MSKLPSAWSYAQPAACLLHHGRPQPFTLSVEINDFLLRLLITAVHVEFLASTTSLGRSQIQPTLSVLAETHPGKLLAMLPSQRAG